MVVLKLGQRLDGQHDHGVFLPQRESPLIDARGENLVEERQPGLVEDDESGGALERGLDPVEQIEEDGQMGFRFEL
jgi:hypothetical protein